MRGLAERWRPRGIRPALPAGRRILPLALASIAVVAAASTAASAARVADRAGEYSVTATDAVPIVPPPFLPQAGSGSTAPGQPGSGAPGAAGSPGSSGSVAGQAGGLAANGIPEVALAAYKAAERRLAEEDPGCGVSWSLLAAIGRVESNHGRFAGATLLKDGRSDPPIVGIPLDGSRAGVARIADTDGGRYDGDARFDRAVGPMQFIPGTWAMFAVDGDGDGRSDPFDLDDVALAAGRYLCRAGGDLRTEAGRRDAVYSYNRSEEYVRLVLDLADEYARGARVDDLPAPDRDPRPLPKPKPPTLPPATVGPPPGADSTQTPSQTATRPSTSAPTSAATTAPGTTPPTTTPPGTTPPGPTPPSTPPTNPPPTSPGATPTCTPAPTSTSATPTVTPSGSPAPTVSPSPTPTETPTGTASPTPTGTPTLPPCPTP
jgi:hypothetical protein